ncbi:MAG: ABC transporter permease [Leptospirales bacterium]|nr:ABC transporter permease [Leptospirales bacterium]
MIGIVIGISSVIAMMGLGSSASVAVQDKILSYGANAMEVKLLRGKNFLSTDLYMIKTYMPQIKHITPLDYINEKDVVSIHRYLKKNHRAHIYFTNEEYFPIQNRDAGLGRLFTHSDVSSTAKVAVIGQTVMKKLFGGDDPIGKIITINNFPFTVIGVLNEKGEALSGRDFDNVTIIPYTSGFLRFEGAIFNKVNLSTNYSYEIPQAKQQITAYVLQRFFSGITNNPKGFVDVSTSDDKLKMARYIANALSILLAGIAAISLFVGGVGIMNIMLVSVTERTREIGIRMAIGAKKADIMLQFLLESFFLCTVGGVLGVILGIGGYYAVVYIVGWPFMFSPVYVIISLAFSAAVGIFFGYYPSKRAAELKPIDALKYE